MKKLWILLLALSPILILGMRDIDRVHAQWVDNRPDKSTSILMQKPVKKSVNIIDKKIKTAASEPKTVDKSVAKIGAKVPANIRQYAERTAKEYGLDPDIIMAQIIQESGGNWKARGAAGELGVGQVLQYNIKPEYKRNYRLQIETQCSIMARNKRAFGSMDKALAAYNAGAGAVRSGRIPKSTRHYVRSIMASAKR